MHGGMLERDRSVGWRTGSARVPLTGETTDEGQGSLRGDAIQDRHRIGTFRHTGALLAAMRRHLGLGKRKPRNYALLAILALTAGGCSTIPDVDEQIAEATSTSAASPLILGADGSAERCAGQPYAQQSGDRCRGGCPAGTSLGDRTGGRRDAINIGQCDRAVARWRRHVRRGVRGDRAGTRSHQSRILYAGRCRVLRPETERAAAREAPGRRGREHHL